MSTEITLPDLGESIESGTVVGVLVAEGEEIVDGQSIIELETDKAVVEVPSTAAGKVTSVAVADGDEVKVGAVLVTLDASGEGPSDAGEPEAVEEPAAESEPETVPAAAQAPAPVAAEPAPPAQKPTEPAATSPPITAVVVAAAPSVRRLAREIGIDIATVVGTGPGGRITVDNVKAHSKALHSARAAAPSAPSPGASVAPVPLPDFTKWGEVEREKLSRLRVAVAANMANAWNTVPHVTQEDRADITDLERWRKESAALVEAQGGKLTLTAIALKIVAAALREYPKFNASIDIESQEIVYKRYVNVGVAVDTDRGLVVPVVRDADRKTLVQLTSELTDLAGKARESKLGLDDMQGGTFTITNLGGLGTTQFTPIVNWPEVAILGMSRGAMAPTWDKERGEFRPRLILPLSVSYDHRIIDGADAARFLRWIAQAFEQPFLMT